VNSPPVLILGGTSEARSLAEQLVQARLSVTSSLAGRVADPALPLGEVRIGGFGGAAGLEDYVRRNDVAVVVDATHPFATTMSASAISACAASSVPLLRLTRPGWTQRPGARSWRWVDTYADAAEAARELGTRIFLTTGRTTLQSFTALSDLFVLVRLVDAADHPLPARWDVIRARGPYTVDGENRLMTTNGIDVLITKDSGGAMTAPKLAAAASLGVATVMVRRPDVADGADVAQVSAVDQAVQWVQHRVEMHGAARASG
jgi:precorrin-6A/cobalt-precorrin-6A reductase